MYYTRYDSPIGPLYLAEDGGAITHLVFAPPGDGFEAKRTPLLDRCAAQLDAYFRRELTAFDLPLAPRGTEFQMRVWRALGQIPYGETWTYKRLAEAASSPRGYRAVGLANNRNPISILIPCHRVIGSDGGLTGYGGGLENKAFLLELERGEKH